MKNRINLLQMVAYISISIVLTLILFYFMSWYSFATLPTSVVFNRMLLSTILLTFSMVLFSMIFKGNKIKP